MKQNLKISIGLLVVTLIVYLPLILSPQKLLLRENDLQEQFWPVFYYIRQHFWQDYSLAFWNSLFFSGTPLLPDPQFSLFYPLNWLFILFPTDYAFFVWLILHTFLGGIFFLILAKSVFRFSILTSFVLAALYITSPRLGAYLEAGHYGLIGTLAWLPLIIISSFKLVISKKIKYVILLGVSLAALFYLHTVTLVLAILFSLFLILTLSLLTKSNLIKITFRFILAALTSLGLTAVTLFTQIEWLPQTTRFLLLQDRDVYPKWISISEFVRSSISPLLLQNQEPLNTEKWLFLGITPIILAFVGFLKLKKLYKILILISLLTVVLIATNNASPAYNLLLSQDWYVLQRVATRIWFVPAMIVLILSGLVLEKLKNNKLLFLGIAVLTILESVLISWSAVNKPIQTDQNRFVPKEIYEFLKNDPGKFRVFCTSRCLSQKQAAIYNLELAEGYNTIQQKNYYQHSWQLFGGYWNYYTLALPPIGRYKNLIPDAKSLGEYSVKYVISPYKIEDKNLVLKNTYNDYYIYNNFLFKPRVYTNNLNGASPNITLFSPNHIKVDIAPNTKSVILAEVYSKGWRAYLDNGKEVLVQETPNALRLVDVEPQTKFVDFRYEPLSYQIGSKITFLVCLVLAGLFFFRRKDKLANKIFK